MKDFVREVTYYLKLAQGGGRVADTARSESVAIICIIWMMPFGRDSSNPNPFLSQPHVLHGFGMLTLCWYIFSHALINRWFKKADLERNHKI